MAGNALRRLARVLLPRPFRARFGDDLWSDIDALARDARRTGGRRGSAVYLWRELVSLVGLAISSRRAPSEPDAPTAVLASLAPQIRAALRHVRRRPAFALAVMGTIALSIGVATTAAGLAHAVLWRDLPFDESSRLVFVWEEVDRDGEPGAARVTGSRYSAWSEAPGPFESLSLFGAAEFTVDEDRAAASLRGVRVTSGYFTTLGIRAALGRTFADGDARPGDHRVVVLSHALWQSRFAGRPDVVGETLRLSGDRHVVIGVMPSATFPGWPVNPADVTLDPEFAQLWVPIPGDAQIAQASRAHVFGVVARLAHGVSRSEAEARLNAGIDTSAPDAHRARVAPFREQLVSTTRAPLLALLGAALAMLLIACANLAALFISDVESRRREMSIRIAIGATASRLANQLGAEALVYAFAGAAGGILVASLALAALPALLPPSVPLLTPPTADAVAVAFACALAIGVCVILAGWPITRLFLAAPSPRGGAAAPRIGVYRFLVVSQLALTMALVTAAGLLARSLYSVENRDPGFATAGVLVAQVGLPAPYGRDGQRISIAEQRLLSAVGRHPNVVAVAAGYDHPLEANWSEAPTIVGDEISADQRQPVELRIVSPGYFEALGVELLEGRTLTPRDELEAPGAMVVNEAFARRIGGRVIGRRIRSGTARFTYPSAPEVFEVVGIVGNERFHGLEVDAQPASYVSTRQFPQTSFSLLVRTAGDPMALAADVRSAVRETDPAMTFDRVTTIDGILAEQLMPRRATTDVVGGFALTALGLAALGIYGLLTVLMGSRVREIGVRLAVGASPSSILRDVLGFSLRMAAAGTLAGGFLAMITGRVVESLLVEVSPRDPVMLGTVAAVLLLTSVCASAIPAWRASRTNPVDALRPE